MQLTCDRNRFTHAFQSAAAAVPSRTPKDVLRNVFMHLDAGAVELVGTDLEVAVRFSVDGVTTSSAGEVLLPTQQVSSILRELSEDEFEINVEEQMLMVRTSSSQFRLSSEDPLEFPPVPEFSESDYFRVPSSVFRQMIRRTSFATDVESTRYALGGILVEFEEGHVTLVATDSRRLAVATAACETQGHPQVPERTTVIPARAMSLLERSVADQAEYVDIAVRDSDVLMRSERCAIYSRLVEGRFPRYRDVIPQETTITVPISVGPFHSAVRQAQIITDEESRGVDFLFSQNRLRLNSRAQDVGESHVELPVEFNSDDIRITFDPRYVSDFLKVLPPESVVELMLTNAETAAVFKVEDSYTYVIMPLAQDR